MKIHFLTDDNPLYVLPFFEEFVKQYSDKFSIDGVSLCRPMGKRSRFALFRQLSALYGPVGMSIVLARFARARCFGILPRRRGAAQFAALSQLFKSYGIAYDHIGNPNDTSFRDSLASRPPDLLISVACPYILKPALLSIPKLGCFNIHHAPLPKYKGMMPTFWQMYHGERSVGITIHAMVERIDEGEILLQDELPIERDESLDKLIRRSKVHAAHCLARVLRQLQMGQRNYISINKDKGSYFSFPTLADIAEFRRRGFRAI